MLFRSLLKNIGLSHLIQRKDSFCPHWLKKSDHRRFHSPLWEHASTNANNEIRKASECVLVQSVHRSMSHRPLNSIHIIKKEPAINHLFMPFPANFLIRLPSFKGDIPLEDHHSYPAIVETLSNTVAMSTFSLL